MDILELYNQCETPQLSFFTNLLLPNDLEFSEENKTLLNELHLAIEPVDNRFSVDDIKQFSNIVKQYNNVPEFWTALHFVWKLAGNLKKHDRVSQCKKAGKASGIVRSNKKIEIWGALEKPLGEALQELKRLENRKGAKQVVIDDVIVKYETLIKDVMEKFSKRKDVHSFLKYQLNSLLAYQETIHMPENPYRVYLKRRRKRSSKKEKN